MKYGESVFDILDLLFALPAGIYILLRARTKGGKAMGIEQLDMSAVVSSPSVNSYSLPLLRSAATAAYGILRSSISLFLKYLSNTALILSALKTARFLNGFNERSQKSLCLNFWASFNTHCGVLFMA